MNKLNRRIIRTIIFSILLCFVIGSCDKNKVQKRNIITQIINYEDGEHYITHRLYQREIFPGLFSIKVKFNQEYNLHCGYDYDFYYCFNNKYEEYDKHKTLVRFINKDSIIQTSFKEHYSFLMKKKIFMIDPFIPEITEFHSSKKYMIDSNVFEVDKYLFNDDKHYVCPTGLFYYVYYLKNFGILCYCAKDFFQPTIFVHSFKNIDFDSTQISKLVYTILKEFADENPSQYDSLPEPPKK